MQSIVDVPGSTLSLTRCALRQIRCPSPARCLAEAAMLSSVFLAAGHFCLGLGIVEMLSPMVPVVLVMMLCSVASGVYRDVTARSVMKLHAHSAYGFVLGAIGFAIVAPHLPDAYSSGRFALFFLLAVFFVTSTVRPLIGGTGVTDGGARRGG